MAIALLATGDEIVQGDTLNTNAYHIAKTLHSEGLALGLHMVCCDEEHIISKCMQFLSESHDIVICIGGLGPTSDDRTRFALAKTIGHPLIEFPEAQAHIEQRLMRSQLAMTAGNRQQALFPEKAHLLPNPNGTAMGCYGTWNNKCFILLPGPPRECLPMFNDYIVPLLQSTQQHDKKQLKWRLFGVAESQIAQQLDDALRQMDCETGYRLETPYVEFKVRCLPELIKPIQAIVEPIVSPHIIASTRQKASEQLREKITQMSESIAICDEVSGGILQTLIHNPQTAAKLHFAQLGKEDFYFHAEGLEQYWSGSQEPGLTQLRLHYQYKGKKGQETHELPYRSAMIIHYAAEWLCFRIFHLINQLHE